MYAAGGHPPTTLSARYLLFGPRSRCEVVQILVTPQQAIKQTRPVSYGELRDFYAKALTSDSTPLDVAQETRDAVLFGPSGYVSTLSWLSVH